MRNRRLLVAGGLLCGLAVIGCSSLGGPRRVAKVSVITAGATLLAIDEAERAMRCGVAGAPEPPLCVPPPLHREISARMEIASTLARDATALVRATPPGRPQPADVARMLASVTQIIRDVLTLIPRSPQRESLVQRLEVAP